MKEGRRMGIGISIKTRPPPRNFSDLRAITGSRLLYQIWGSGSRGFYRLGNSSYRTGVTVISYIHPCKFQIVPAGRDFGRRIVDPTKPSMETRRFVRYMGVCVVQGKKIKAVMGMGGK